VFEVFPNSLLYVEPFAVVEFVLYEFFAHELRPATLMIKIKRQMNFSVIIPPGAKTHGRIDLVRIETLRREQPYAAVRRVFARKPFIKTKLQDRPFVPGLRSKNY
jgi:hypothetical protein